MVLKNRIIYVSVLSESLFMMYPTQILGPINVFFVEFLSVKDSLEFCFSKNILIRHIQIFLSKAGKLDLV